MKIKIAALIILGILLSMIIYSTALAEEESTNHSHAVPNATAIPTPTPEPTVTPTPTPTSTPVITSTPIPTPTFELSPQQNTNIFSVWLFIIIIVVLVFLLLLATRGYNLSKSAAKRNNTYDWDR